MPYMKQKDGDKWKVYKKGEDGKPTGKALGTHESESDADKQIAAIYASENANKSARTGELHKFAPLLKVEQRKDGTPIVWFKVASEMPDSEGEICDYAHSKPNFLKHSADVAAISKGKSKFNVREQHGETAAGRAVEFLARDVEKDFIAGVEIVDKGTLEKFEKGVLNGASIGGKYGDWSQKDGAYRRYEAVPVEFSIVDVPSNGEALPIDMPGEFEFVRANGSKEMRKFMKSTSLQDTVDAVRSAWYEKFEPTADGMRTGWVCDVRDDSVVVQQEGKYFSYAYAKGADETITWGEPVEVERGDWEPVSKSTQPGELGKAGSAAAAGAAKDDGNAAKEPAAADGAEGAEGANAPSKEDLRAVILEILEELGLVVKEGDTMKAAHTGSLQKAGEALDLVKADLGKLRDELAKSIKDGDETLAKDIAKVIVDGEALGKRVDAVTGMGPVVQVPGGPDAQNAAIDREIEVLKKYQESAKDPHDAARFGEMIAAAEIRKIQNPKKAT